MHDVVGVQEAEPAGDIECNLVAHVVPGRCCRQVLNGFCHVATLHQLQPVFRQDFITFSKIPCFHNYEYEYIRTISYIKTV